MICINYITLTFGLLLHVVFICIRLTTGKMKQAAKDCHKQYQDDYYNINMLNRVLLSIMDRHGGNNQNEKSDQLKK